jgi:hypothetical protein
MANVGPPRRPTGGTIRHCEARSAEAIPHAGGRTLAAVLDCFATLAMTPEAYVPPPHRPAHTHAGHELSLRFRVAARSFPLTCGARRASIGVHER